jgi:hypothetical protein
MNDSKQSVPLPPTRQRFLREQPLGRFFFIGALVFLFWLGSLAFVCHRLNVPHLEQHRLQTLGQVGEAMAITGVLFSGLGFVALIATVWLQRRQIEAAIQGMEESTRDMKESIGQATRSADAMEKSAKAVTVGSQAAAQSVILLPKQMRAYLSVRINSGFYQDRPNWKFEVKPMLINTGLTPALKVGYAAKADVLPFPLADEFVFPSLEKPRSVFGLLAPQHDLIINAMVESDFDEGEVENIKRGRGRRLYIWGTIVYEDVFGQPRYTNFAHNIIWVLFKDGSEAVTGNYVDRHNEAT